ncbi:MAG: NUDIX domain-containing protein [Clostridia bacterium]|nr:NUDIX domain-containing protein [Clostridia bacterium]
MAVRNSAKAIIVRDEKILLNRCHSRFGIYYALPGGGQRPGELLPETIRREVMEETGYTAEPTRMAGIYEQITRRWEGAPDHKMYFLFRCRLSDAPRCAPSERDAFQLSSEWVELAEAVQGRLFPRTVRDNLMKMIYSDTPIYLGSERKG